MDISARGRAATRRRAPAPVKLKVGNGNGGNGHAAAPYFDLKKLLRALQSVRDGDFSVRLAPDQTGLGGKIADTFNELVSSNQRLCQELERAGQMVGLEGKTRMRIASERRTGAWGAMDSSVNTLFDMRTISSACSGGIWSA